jgi:hypothetical protein
MGQYLLSTYAVEGQVPGAPSTPDEMRSFMERVMDLESEMDAAGAFVFGGALHEADAATVVRPIGAGVMTTDGPFVESKEQIGGFYVVNADDLDAALAWARKAAAATNHPIEVRPFRATGRLKDHASARAGAGGGVRRGAGRAHQGGARASR